MNITKDTTVTEYIEERIKFLESREGLPMELACIGFGLKELRMVLNFIETPVNECSESGCNIKWREL